MCTARKINVLFISHESGINGAPLSLLDLIIEIKEYIQPIVIIPHEGYLERRLIDYEIKYYIVPFNTAVVSSNEDHTTLSIVREKTNYHAAQRVAEIIELEEIDIVHSNTSVVDVGVFAAMKKHIPHVWHLREFAYEDFGLLYSCKEKNKRELFSRSNCISVSKAISDKYLHSWNCKSTIIYNGIHLNSISKSKKIITDSIDILIVGAISEKKGQLEVIQAVDKLSKLGYNTKLYIVGNVAGLFAEVLQLYVEEKQLDNNVFFLGEISNYQNIVPNVDIAIMASKMEALGRVTIEYMAMGIPVVGTKTGGTVELIGINEERGYFYESGNVDSLVDTIIKCKNDGKKKKKIKAAKEFVLEEFSPKSYSKKIIQFYENTLNSFDVNDFLDIKILNEVKESLELDIDSFHDQNDFSAQKAKFISLMSDELSRIQENSFDYKIFFEKIGARNVVIYGLGKIGRIIFKELTNNGINITGIVDRDQKVDCIKLLGVHHYYPDDNSILADIIIITVLDDGNIKKKLTQNSNAKIIYLDEFLSEIKRL